MESSMAMESTHNRSTRSTYRWRARLGAVATTAGIAVGALVLTAPFANAEPIKESTIKSECKSAGGTYGTVVKQGTRFSSCRYKDIGGDGYVDYYADGEYYSTRPT
jgi:hypothetical protein